MRLLGSFISLAFLLLTPAGAIAGEEPPWPMPDWSIDSQTRRFRTDEAKLVLKSPGNGPVRITTRCRPFSS